jgi:hypothetical protein
MERNSAKVLLAPGRCLLKILRRHETALIWGLSGYLLSPSGKIDAFLPIYNSSFVNCDIT